VARCNSRLPLHRFYALLTRNVYGSTRVPGLSGTIKERKTFSSGNNLKQLGTDQTWSGFQKTQPLSHYQYYPYCCLQQHHYASSSISKFIFVHLVGFPQLLEVRQGALKVHSPTVVSCGYMNSLPSEVTSSKCFRSFEAKLNTSQFSTFFP